MMYEIGIITTTHGIKGELKVKELSDFDRFQKGEQFFIIYNDEKLSLTVESVRSHKQSLIIKFKEYNNINDVLVFKDLIIYSNNQGELLEDEYYFQDLIDLKVYTDDDNMYLGIVTEVIELPHGHLLEVWNEDKKILIPFEEVFIKSVLEDKIIVSLIEGLIWK